MWGGLAPGTRHVPPSPKTTPGTVLPAPWSSPSSTVESSCVTLMTSRSTRSCSEFIRM